MSNAFDLTPIETLYDKYESTIARDLKLNLKKLLSESSLDAGEAALGLLATASSVDDKPLAEIAKNALRALDFTNEQITEAAESAAMMAMLNMYYRFKHMIGHSEETKALYTAAGLRMTALAKPQLGKERFEMLAFAVSVLNGCETCITSHEKVLRAAGIDANKIHDLARLAAVVKAVKTLTVINTAGAE